jgi:hypothetical protein
MPARIPAVSFIAATLVALPAAARAQGAPFCLKNALGAVSCAYHSMILCEQAKQPNSHDQCIPRLQADETTGSSGAPLGRPRQPAGVPRAGSPGPAR